MPSLQTLVNTVSTDDANMQIIQDATESESKTLGAHIDFVATQVDQPITWNRLRTDPRISKVYHDPQ